MALTDNLVLKIKAASGETVITDAINSISLSSGAGTAALVDDATHGFLWRITGGQKTATFSTLGKYLDTTARSSTIAIRLRITSRVAYSKYAVVGADAANNHLAIMNNSNATGALRAAVVQAGAVTTPYPLPSYTSGDVMTVVFRLQETGTTSDLNDVWTKVHGGSVGQLTQVTNSVTSVAREITYLALGVTSGETLDIMNFAAWNRGLSDAEAASVADDITQLWGAAGPTTTIATSLANITGSVASKASPKTAISATLANVTGSVACGSGSLVTTIATTLGNIVGSINSTGSTTNGTFTSEILKDYAGNALVSVSMNFVRLYNQATGALVLSKTGVSTNASGIVSFTDAALTAGTGYRIDWETSTGSRRMPIKAAT